MKIFHGSIRKKLILLVLLATTPAVLVLLGTEYLYRQHATEEARKDAANYLHSFTALQEKITSSTRTLLRTIASIPAIKQGEVAQSRVILSTLLEANPIYTNAILVDLQGDVIAAGKNHDKAIKLNFGDRKQFKDALTDKGFSSGEFVVGKSSKKPIFPFGMAILDENNNAKGALIIGVRLDHYGELFESGSYGNEAFFGLSDSNGFRLFRYPESPHTTIGDPIKREVFQAASTTNRPGSTTAITTDGQKRIVVYEPLRISPASPAYMYMFMGMDHSMIQEKANTILIQAAITSLSSLAFAVIIAWFIGGRGIASRMQKLTALTKRFSSGDRNFRSTIDYNDGEIGQLAQSFDNMLDMIEEKDKERDNILDQLSVSEKRFRELIEDVSEISIQGYDEQRVVTFWNKASEKLYGYTHEDAIGKKLEDLIIPVSMREEVIRAHTRWLENGEKIPPAEMTLIDKAGYDVPVFSSHVMNETQYGKEMFCIDIDMRPLKASEDERELLIHQLKQSQKMEAIGTLAGGIAHDFNNILVPILGYSEMLREEADNLENLDEESLNQIHASALRAKDLVQQILTFSRQEATEYQTIQVQPILEEVVKLLRSTIPRKIEIKHEIEHKCPPVNGDATQIHQILMNLATNAFHSMTDTGGAITFGLAQKDIVNTPSLVPPLPSGTYVVLSVSDTGSGMPKAIVEKIFDPFFTTKEKGKGTGMGLSVVHGIVESMQGKINVQSEQGQGTQFTIYLPAADNHNLKQSQSAPIETESTGAENILLVDDEEPVLRMTERALSKAGYQVTAMSDPTDALQMYRDDPDRFDLVLTDISMPIMTGDELTKQILQIRPDQPVILCTGYSERITEDSAKKIGVREIFSKPMMPKDLTRKVRIVLDSINNKG